MHKIFLIAAALMVTTALIAQEYPLKTPRPKPVTATLVGVCEGAAPKLMVAIFTYTDGKVLTVDGKHMQGFESADAIVRYAATATSVNEYAQTCGVVKGGEGTETL